MAYLIKSDDVHIGGEIITEMAPIEFLNGRNLGSLPTIYDQNWGYVVPVNHWFIHLKANKRLENLSSYARALLHYWNFLESENLIWDVFPLAKGLKPTYRYRNDKLLKSVKAGELAYSTANTYMTHVVQFYLWAAHERYYHISEKHKPFEIEFVRIQRSDMLVHMMPKFLVQTTDLRIRTPRDATSKNIRGLKPLTQISLTHLALHLRNVPCEFRLICLLAAQSGLRIQEASGLTLAALEQSVQRSGSITHFELTIGPGNGVPTKYNKTRTIEITSRLLSDLKTYAISERRMRRLDKLLSKIEFHKGIHDIKKSHDVHVSKEKLDALTTAQRYEPLFISQQGNPYDPNTIGSRFGEVRRSIIKSGIQFEHKFHDLRCSYATYRLHSLLEAGFEPANALSLLMGWMGHKNESTTWKYLQYLKRKEALKEKISVLDSIMHQALEDANEQDIEINSSLG
ncbi:TPA: tyrosine recombinase XerC [Escherichia coli]